MKTELTPQQRQEIPERLATEVMGWRKRSTSYPNNRFSTFWETEETKDKIYGVGYAYQCHSDQYEGWNPTEDWNHFREVEEAFMSDTWTCNAYIIQVFNLVTSYELKDGHTIAAAMVVASLPTRCLALIAAIDSLKKHD